MFSRTAFSGFDFIRSISWSLIAFCAAACIPAASFGTITIADQSGNGHTGTLGAGVGFTATSPTLSGSYAIFANPTDSIELAGNVSLSTQDTFEAIIKLSPITTPPSEAGIWDAWEFGGQDSRFSIDNNNSVLGYSFPVGYPTAFIGGSLSTGTWYDLAYVFDGSQERIYVNGSLVSSRSSSGTISTGSSADMVLGAIYRDSGLIPTFEGDLASLRISNDARYSGSSYTPISGIGYYSSDSHTQALYNFNTASAVPEPASMISLLMVGSLPLLRRSRVRAGNCGCAGR